MTQANPTVITSFDYKGETYQVNWYAVESEDQLPEANWYAIHAIAMLDGQAIIVKYASDKDNLPGGRIEHGETLEQALTREMDEELNCRITSWQPLGYQRATQPDGKEVFEVHALAQLRKVGDFHTGVGGSVIGYELVPLAKVNQYIKFGDSGDAIVSQAQKLLTKNS